MFLQGIGGAGVVGLYRLGFPSKSSTTSPSINSMGAFKSDLVFEEIKDRITTEKDLVKKVATSFSINIAGDDGSSKKWIIDAQMFIVPQSEPPYVGHDEKPVEVEINIKDSDFMNIAAGKLKPDQAFMQGKMKLKGNIAKAMKLRSILDPKMLKAKI
ncbi:SCP-2 sterol transfer family protein [Dictyocaulus viviparus]|uniref:SCP-2 sterol transfer family protein n=1 Tax=Dictyocaulus viviparus TaxID=29172 RepID=A0A0D8Y794_DICVI|nr:SCP-2 sterol transfer family protein [Dictyocaulus viviparus]